MEKLVIVLVLVLIMTAGVTNATLVASDDFSSGDETGGTGWAADWVDYNGNPLTTTMNVSTADPFNENASVQYRSAALDTWDGNDPAPAYVKRTLATSIMFSTTPEVWIGVYLRPTATVLTDDGWQFGFEVGEGLGSFAGFTGGAEAGAPYEVLVADGGSGGATGDGTSVFTFDQEILLVLHLYKSGGGGGPNNQKYNKADLFADLDGTDGRYNNEVAIVTGYGLTAFDEISVIQLYSEDFAVDFDYVAIGTTKADVTEIIPEPSTIALLGLGGSALLRRKKRR